MGGRHRFAGEDRTVRPLLAAVVPVVAVAGMTVAVMLGSNGQATSTPRIEVPRFSSSDTAGPQTTLALPAALPTGAPAVLQVSAAGTSAVQRIADERAEAAARAEQERAAAAAAAAARDRAARDAAARSRAAVPVPVPVPAPTQAQPLPAAPVTEPRTADEPDTTRATPDKPERPRGLLGSLLGGG